MSVGTAVRRAVPSGIDPKIWARRVAVARARGQRLRGLTIAVSVVVAVAVLGLGILHSGWFEARHRTVLGAQHTSPAAVWSAAGIGSATPLVDVSPSAAAARVDRLPWVLRATVRRSWPDAVVVRVVERVPVAVVGGPGDAVVVDRTGRILAPASAVPAAAALPRLVAPGGVGRPGSWLGSAAGPALVVAAAVPPAIAGQVQQVTTDASGQVTVGLVGGVQVDFGPAVAVAAKFESLVAVLADPASAPTGPAVIDVRAPGEPTVGPPSAA
ncbi:MAG: FtsQ-type POTRA domain-containing protein [Actinomycetota bacterium]|nr:FtsQ-type POTRA domain-containing protein [Actinomycetota bacterium]